MIKFKKVSKYANTDFDLPVRKTEASAGYDFVVARDTLVPSYMKQMDKLRQQYIQDPLTLKEMKTLCKSCDAKPTLVSTGVKCYLEPDTYLELSVRSSTPLNSWLILANSKGIIDADYADNPDNEGEIFFQLINLSPYDIMLQKGDVIGQGIIYEYLKTDDDAAVGQRIGGFGSTSNQQASAAANHETPNIPITFGSSCPNLSINVEQAIKDSLTFDEILKQISNTLYKKDRGK